MATVKDREIQAILVFLVMALIMHEKFVKKDPQPQPLQQYYTHPYWRNF